MPYSNSLAARPRDVRIAIMKARRLTLVRDGQPCDVHIVEDMTMYSVAWSHRAVAAYTKANP